MGLPGAGKTTLARILASELDAVHFNADEVRANINKDLGFSPEDRIEQARRMGWLCDKVVEAGGTAIADFVCPTTETREAFGDAFVVWVDRIEEGRFADTNKLFMRPENYDIRISAEGSPEESARKVFSALTTARSQVGLPGPKGQWPRRGRGARFWAATAALRDMLKPSEISARSAVHALVYLLLCSAVLILRHSVDAQPFEIVNSMLQIGFLGAAMLYGGAVGAICAFFFVEGFEFFLVEPVFTLGAQNWDAVIEFAFGSLIAAGFGIAAGRRWASRVLSAGHGDS
jgi:adenylylsulfate kinase